MWLTASLWHREEVGVEQDLGAERIINVEEERSRVDGYAARTKIHVIIHFYLKS
jgi:hypothetical protein